jgi:hypothetical protein
MFRFTIRELVLLTLVVAMGVGMALQQSTLERARKEASWNRYRLERLVAYLKWGGYRVMWEDEMGTPGVVGTYPLLRQPSDSEN